MCTGSRETGWGNAGEVLLYYYSLYIYVYASFLRNGMNRNAHTSVEMCERIAFLWERKRPHERKRTRMKTLTYMSDKSCFTNVCEMWEVRTVYLSRAHMHARVACMAYVCLFVRRERDRDRIRSDQNG